MPKRCISAIAVLAVLFTASSSAAGPPAEDAVLSAENEIDALWQKIDSYSASIHVTTKLRSMTMRLRTQGQGELACMKTEGKLLYRVKLDTTTSMGGGGFEPRAESSVKDYGVEEKKTHVFDGEYHYLQTVMYGKPSVVKIEPMPCFLFGMVPGSGRPIFEELHKDYDLTLLPEEEVDGQQAYAFRLESKLKYPDVAVTATGAKLPSQGKAWFSKNTGLPLRLVILFPEDKPHRTVEYKDIKINPSLDPILFEYTPPEGAPVVEPPPREAKQPDNEPKKASS